MGFRRWWQRAGVRAEHEVRRPRSGHRPTRLHSLRGVQVEGVSGNLEASSARPEGRPTGRRHHKGVTDGTLWPKAMALKRQHPVTTD